MSYSDWLRKQDFTKAEDYWRRVLSGFTAPTPLVVDRAYSSKDDDEAVYARKNIRFSGSVTLALQSLARQHQLTLNTLLQGAWALVLSRYSGEDEVMFGVTRVCRPPTLERGETIVAPFTNTLPLRVPVSAERLLLPWLQELRAQWRAMGDYKHTPLIKVQRWSDISAGKPLFESIVVFENDRLHSSLQAQGGDWENREFRRVSAPTNYPLMVTGYAEPELALEMVYDQRRFDDATIGRMLGHLQTVLEGMAANPGQQLSDLSILTDEEYQQLLIDWNNTAAEHPKNKCIHEMFEAQVKRTPETVAVVFEEEQLTYRELNARADQLAHHLRALGVGPEVLVGICVERSLEMVVGLLGILKAGGAYVPLDPAYPKERLAFMLADIAQTKFGTTPVLLTQQRLLERLPDHGVEVVCLDSDEQALSSETRKVGQQSSLKGSDLSSLAKKRESGSASGVTGDNLAYVIYTSGSTGRPKGVAVSHQNLVHSTSARMTYYREPVTRFLLLSSFAFDSSCVGLFWTFCQGGTLLLPPPDLERDLRQLTTFVAQQQPSHMLSLPSLYGLLLRQAGGQQLGSLGTIMVAGESCPSNLVVRHREQLPGVSLFNEYGPTEATVWSSVYESRSLGQSQQVPIGRPIANMQIYLLDAHLQPVPIGVPGELYIGGVGLARGYLNHPGLTAENFIPNPFSAEPGCRLYKTGDLACYLPDGNIEFLGRIDHQVKIRGYRVELGEIETVLSQHSGVRDTVVLAREDVPGDRRLVAYVTQNPYDPGSTGEVIEWRDEQIAQWQIVFDETHSQSHPHPDATFNTIGWNSRYTGQPIPEEEMRAWVDDAVERILSLQPNRVLEIGCGTGLLLFRIAPHCKRYCGIDFSQAALEYIRQQLNRLDGDSSGVTLFQKAADDFEGVEAETFDAVILNSVVQYFPDMDYFLRVLEGAVNAVAPGGFIFVGDVRSLPLLEAFHTSVQLHQAEASLSITQFKQRVQRQMAEENELIIDPAFFIALKQHLPKIGDVEILPKRGRYHNELTRFRYQVIIHVGCKTDPSVDVSWLDWQKEELTLPAIHQLLVETAPEILGIRRVPNARLLAEVKTLEWLANEDEPETVGELREALREIRQEVGVDPEELWSLSGELPYAVNISWSSSGADGSYDVVFRRRMTVGTEISKGTFFPFPGETVPLKFWNDYANNPLQRIFTRKLVVQLRRFLQEKLPEYMMPSAFVMLEALPLNPNGKVDRRALPPPGPTRPELETAYVRPRTELEHLLANIWQEVLGIEKIGIYDNFFELGGDSLKGAVFVNRLQEALNEYIYIVILFEAPTIADLAAYLNAHYSDAVARVCGVVSVQSPESGSDKTAPGQSEKIDASKVATMRQWITPLSPREESDEITASKNPRAIFILTSPRSGSTLFRVMLAGHPRLFAPPELNLLSFNTLEERKAIPNADSLLLTGTIRALMEIKGCDVEEAKRVMEDFENQQYTTKQYYRLMQEWLGEKTLVDKTAAYALDLETLKRAEMDFDNALYIHLLRHPCGMVHSFEKVRLDRVLFRDRHAFSAREVAELTWLICNQNILEFLKDVPTHRQYQLKFEELVNQPGPVMAEICQFLGLQMHPDMLQPYQDKKQRMTDGIYPAVESRMLGDVKFHEHRDIDPRVADRWREDYTEDFLGDITWQMAESLGYERLSQSREASSPAGLAPEISQRPGRQDGAEELPTVVPAPEQRHLPFPLTDIQQAYWIGRTGSFELGNVASHRYIEVDSVDLDLERFNLTWQRLIERHDMLRAVMLPDGQQQILEQVPPYQIEVLDLRRQDPKTVSSELAAIRRRMSHQVLPSDQWPLFEICASRLDDRRVRLHLSFDALIIDGWSRFLLFREWSQLYQNPETSHPPLECSFRDYVLAGVALKDSALYQRSRDYWWGRLATLPPAPELPLAKNPSSVTQPRFVLMSTRLEPETWLRLKNRASRASLTPSGVLAAAFVEVLKVWSKSPRFVLNLTLFNRLPLHPQVNDVLGNFTSLTMLEVNHAAEEPFEIRARRLQEQLWNDLSHRYVSGVEVMRQLARQGGGEPRAAMPVVFTSLLPHGIQATRDSQLSWLGEVVYTVGQTPQVWLDHLVVEEAGALELIWNAVEELFPEGFLDDMFDVYCGLLERLADEEKIWQASWPEMARQLLPSTQLEQRVAINATEAPVPDGTLHTLFAAQVPQRPDQPAVVAANQTLTYADLHRRANQVGHRLRQLGARPNRLVAVVMEKGWEQVVAVLGILASGAAYLPIDAGLPRERLWYLLEHGEVELVLTQSWLDEDLTWPEGLQRLCVDREELAGVHAQSLVPTQGPDDLAYVIYTSGSTGLPKGVVIDHRGAVNTILDINRRFGVGAQDRVLALSSLSFDLSVYDIFGTLAAGGTMVIPERSGTRDPSHWAELIIREQVTIWNSVPALMALLVEYLAGHPERRPDALRLVMLSGDWIPVALPDKIRALVEEVQIISLGGATEASIWSILYPIETVDPGWPSIPYGKPMMNQNFHVLNEALEPCPVWVPGQLYIGGIGLAKGYWRDEEKTCASFITPPRTGERLYHTGDLGRYLPDGNIEFLGRADFQVKIQGFRVELGEIEVALTQHPGVGAAVVTASGEVRGEKRLVAYLVAEEAPVPTPDVLRQFLAQRLPEYMVPAAYVILEELPLTANGKVDRKALPEPPDADFESPQPGQAATFDRTTQIAQIVASVLKLDQVHPEANLLDLGATSVDMIRIVNRLDNELSFRPQIDVLYRQPTVLALAGSYQQQLQSQETPAGVVQVIEPTPASVLASFDLVLDPEEREAFKRGQPGLRRGDEEKSSVQLVLAQSDDVLQKAYAQRRSHRQFAIEPIPLAQFSNFLSCLRQLRLDGEPKYLYASAGGLYPVQTYLYIKPEHVETLDAGIYYYHPVDHRLVMLTADVELDRNVYDLLVNRPIFDEAGFAIFLITQLSAIAPMYGERSMHYATIEAGLMSQLLEMSAPTCGIGLCQIGSLDFQRIQHLFALGESHLLIHSLLGGLIDSRLGKRWSPFQEAYHGKAVSEGDWEEGEI